MQYIKAELVNAYPAKIEGEVMGMAEDGALAPVDVKQNEIPEEGYIVTHQNGQTEWVAKEEFERKYIPCELCPAWEKCGI